MYVEVGPSFPPMWEAGKHTHFSTRRTTKSDGNGKAITSWQGRRATETESIRAHGIRVECGLVANLWIYTAL